MRNLLWVVPTLMVLGGGARAHESLLRNIAAVTEDIASAPENASLYLRRGELFRLHRDARAARADFDRARQLEPELADVDFYMAQLQLEEGTPAAALFSISEYLEKKPYDGRARTIRARALAALSRPREAVSEYTRALDRHPSPELYLERAEVLVTSDDENVARAIAGLEEGVVELGSVPALELRIIALELHRGHVEAALSRIDLAAARSRHKVPWLVRRAEALEGAKEYARARRDYEAARAELYRLPEHRRRTRMFQDLEKRIGTALARLAPG